MPSFIVDPLLVTAPSQNADGADAGRWLGAIDRWLQEVESSPFVWRHLLECTDMLMRLGRFPTFDHLRRAQRLSRMDVNVGLLLRRISAFFQSKDHDLLRLTATQCAVVEENQPIILPVEILDRNEADVRPSMTNALLCVACDRAAGMKFAASAHIVTLPFNAGERMVSIKATIALIDPEHVRLPARALDEAFPALFTPDDLNQFTHADDLLTAGAAGFSKFIDRVAHAQSSGFTLSCQVGSEFWESLSRSGIDTDRAALEKLIRICAAVLLSQAGEINVDLRPVRLAPAADSLQLRRHGDGARAWRLTITKKGVGWRLHYWHIPPREPVQEERIEFACVLRKQDPVRMPDAG